MQKLTWPRIAAWRVQRHHLNQRAPAGSMFAVASRLCGLHAQVLSSAVLTLWARVEGLNRDAVRRALWEDRTLVKRGPCGARFICFQLMTCLSGMPPSAPVRDIGS